MTTNGKPPQAIHWATDYEQRKVTRLHRAGPGLTWGDRLLVTALLGAGFGGIAAALILAGGLLYLGAQLAGQVLRLVGAGR